MKEKIKTICLIVITFAIFVGAVSYCWSVFEKQIYHYQKQKCVETCYSKTEKEAREKDISLLKLMEACSKRCEVIPSLF